MTQEPASTFLTWTSSIGPYQDVPSETAPPDRHSVPGEPEIATSEPEQTRPALELAPPGMLPINMFRLPPAKDDPNELLKRRFLCRGGAMLLVGPTGIGKSSFVLQAAVRWSLGQPFFGIEPAKDLRCLIVQAENDDGDIAEMRDGVCRGLLAAGEMMPSDETRIACRIAVVCEDSRTGHAFGNSLNKMLEYHKPDLLIIDPALAYLGGDALKQADVTLFCRNILNPIIHRHRCGLVLVHHTNKPPRGEEKGDWKAGDLAYLGQGAADWANWARAVVAIRTLGSHSIFELCLGKRGRRAGWRDADGKALFAKYIAHSTDPDTICWREPDEKEVLAAANPDGLPAAKKDWTEARRQAIAMAREKVRTKNQLQNEFLRMSPGVTPSQYEREIIPFLNAARDDGELEMATAHDGEGKVYLVGPKGGAVMKRKDEITAEREARKQKEMSLEK